MTGIGLSRFICQDKLGIAESRVDRTKSVSILTVHWFVRPFAPLFVDTSVHSMIH